MDEDPGIEARLLSALAAEEDAGMRRLIAALLEAGGSDVGEVTDGAAAVDIAEDGNPTPP